METEPLKVVIILVRQGDSAVLDRESFMVEDFELAEDVCGRVDQFVTTVIEQYREGQYHEDFERAI